jgi:hypothetical protein
LTNRTWLGFPLLEDQRWIRAINQAKQETFAGCRDGIARHVDESSLKT